MSNRSCNLYQLLTLELKKKLMFNLKLYKATYTVVVLFCWTSLQPWTCTGMKFHLGTISLVVLLISNHHFVSATEVRDRLTLLLDCESLLVSICFLRGLNWLYRFWKNGWGLRLVLIVDSVLLKLSTIKTYRN